MKITVSNHNGKTLDYTFDSDYLWMQDSLIVYITCVNNKVDSEGWHILSKERI